ncbi:unnamed protein product [Oikopleura dioica]|uniref:Uncharacterized protein n=1 Tax=Oikopleura dioica TaxID=34765 RepID=E4YF38_OIKDI|nr:unnamed protein product [Oikopleura dioica]
MLELSILAFFATCIAGMIQVAKSKKEKLPVWERENGKNEIEKWLEGFLAKLKRTSTRTEKCRLILAVERMQFEEDWYAAAWNYVQFGEENGEIFDKWNESLQNLNITEFQKQILKSNSSLKNQLVGHSEIKEEKGEWNIPAELKTKIISEGGEALVFSEKFGIYEIAVRIQIFDPFLFTENFGLDLLTWKINFEKAAATPGFADQRQFTLGDGYNVVNLWYFLFCDWKSSWNLLYKPIDEKEKKEIDKIVQDCNATSIHKIKEGKIEIIREITSVIKIPSSSCHFCLDDANLTKSLQVSSLKQNVTKCVNQDLENVTKNVLNQKSSNLCVPISVATILRFAIKNDLGFKDEHDIYSAEAILSSLLLIVYPRSMAGLNLNPKQEETEFQVNQIELILERLCKKTYLMETGWQIIQFRWKEEMRPKKSTCKFKKVLLHENFVFSRPLTVTGAFLLPNGEILFHQMTLDRIENNEYVLQNNQFSVDHPPVIRIKQRLPYYAIPPFIDHLIYQTGNNIEVVGNIQNVLISERHNMNANEWYLLPHAYSITLVPEKD